VVHICPASAFSSKAKVRKEQQGSPRVHHVPPMVTSLSYTLFNLAAGGNHEQVWSSGLVLVFRPNRKSLAGGTAWPDFLSLIESAAGMAGLLLGAALQQ